MLSLLVLIIFVPKGGFSTIPADHLTCVFDAEEGDTGQIIVPSETKEFPQYPDLNFMEQYEFEQGVNDSSFVQGKLRLNASFWRDVIQASAFVLDIIEHGYKITFQELPLPYSIDNRSSTIRHEAFVRGAVNELLVRGCIREVFSYPDFCNPLHVAKHTSSYFRRIILDVSRQQIYRQEVSQIRRFKNSSPDVFSWDVRIFFRSQVGLSSY